MGFMTYQTTRFIMYVSNIVLWPLTRVFIFLWIFPEEFVVLAFETASRVFACVLYFFYSSRCFYIDCSIEAHSEREKKKNMHFFSSVAGQVSFVIHWHCYCWFYYKPTKLIRLHICIYSIAMHPSVKENQELEEIKWNGKNNIRTHQWQ